MRKIPVLAMLALLIVPSTVLAGIFTPPPTDKSVEFLGYIFGNRVGALYLGGTPNPTLMRMFEMFNASIVIIGVLIVSYIGIVSTINTAQEGKTMGRKFASIWIPLRAALGMAILVPTPASGYSIVQVSVMWLILQGVGAADHIWNGILGDLSTGIGVTRSIVLNEPTMHEKLLTEGAKLTPSVLASVVCATSLQKISEGPAEFRSPKDSITAQLGKHVDLYETKVNVVVTDDEATVSGALYVGIKGNDKFNDICGKYTIVGSVDRAEWQEPDRITKKELEHKARQIYQHKVNAIHSMYNVLGNLARLIVNESLKPRAANNRLIVREDEPIIPEGYRHRAMGIYAREMAHLTKPQHIDSISDIVREGVLSGWVAAGSFYFALNKTYDVNYFDNITLAPVADLIPVCNNADHCTVHLPDNTLELNAKLRNVLQYNEEKTLIATRLWDANVYLDADSASSVERLNVDVSEPDPTNADMQRLQKQVAIDLAKMMSERNLDPIIAQGKFGASIMASTEKIWMDNLNEQHVMLNLMREGTVEDTPAIRARLDQLTQSGSFFLSIYGFLWVIGATLAIYIPLIPYMMFAVGVLGWFLLVIEAIVAAPVLALSFILPSGEELGKIMQGLMLLFNIILRPTLMLFGFVLAARLYGVIVEFVNFSMIGNFANLDTSSSMFAWAAILTLYAAFIIALANKCFALIYALPDKILRWMGGAPEHTDASQEMHQAKAAMGKGADTINKISTGFGERGFIQSQNRSKQLNPPDIGGGDKKPPE